MFPNVFHTVLVCNCPSKEYPKKKCHSPILHPGDEKKGEGCFSPLTLKLSHTTNLKLQIPSPKYIYNQKGSEVACWSKVEKIVEVKALIKDYEKVLEQTRIDLQV